MQKLRLISSSISWISSIKVKNFLVSLLFFPFCVFAEDSCFEVNGVTSKAISVNSLAAKQSVFSNALKRAFGRMLERYFPEVSSLQDKVEERTIQDCVYDYSIDQEKFSGKTYIARFSFRFSKKAVENLLLSRNMLAREKKESEANVVAVYTQDYLQKYSQLQKYKVIVFSPKRVLLEISKTESKSFLNAGVAFAKSDVKTYS